MSDINPEYLDITSALRKVRLLKGYTLEDVQSISNGEFTANTLGSYERNGRSISLKRLLRLCEVYNVSLTSIINNVMWDSPLHAVPRRDNELRTTA